MNDVVRQIIEEESPNAIARGKALKQKRVQITDSFGRKSYPRYTELDPILLDPYTLVVFKTNRAYLIKGSNLEPLADRFIDEAITSLQPSGKIPGSLAGITSITMHWLYDKTPEEFLIEILEQKPLEKVS